MAMKKTIRRLIVNSWSTMTPRFIKQTIIKNGLKKENYAKESYSQEGEDRILGRIFEGQSSGFYVDVGAHHPSRFSNTKVFYDKGWRGINIDALPGTKDLFDEYRPGDINLELGVSSKQGSLTYFMFNEPALNTFDPLEAEKKDGLGQYHLTGTVQIDTKPLGQILSEHLIPGKTIDFMSVDVEGLDMEVLRSNDWQTYKPRIVLVESIGRNQDLISHGESEMHDLFLRLGYFLSAKTMNTFFYVLKDE